MFNNHSRRASSCVPTEYFSEKLANISSSSEGNFMFSQYGVLNKRMFQLGCCSENVPDTHVINLKEKGESMTVSLTMPLVAQVAAMILVKVS